ncbi:MAG: ABC transporter ATP-binding protein, partial [Gammaproteobacteria bacterium]|nr:ABC transporter ATP-binding protein [Gammaproteobacteria bacterium]
MQKLIEVEQLTRYYGDHCAVNNVSFALEKGEILGFLGPNGAGKTSTMQMICGNLAPTSGQVLINGIDMLDQPKEAKRALGYLPEIPPVYRDLTVDEFLGYCARLHGIPMERRQKALDQARERTGLKDVADRLIGNLSKGYQQRVGIAQAIVHMPDVIILDEPTVGLDPIQIREIRELIRDLGQEHGVILSTHILSEVQESCTRVQIIHQGRLVFNDRIEGL